MTTTAAMKHYDVITSFRNLAAAAAAPRRINRLPASKPPNSCSLILSEENLSGEVKEREGGREFERRALHFPLELPLLTKDPLEPVMPFTKPLVPDKLAAAEYGRGLGI
ncbi:hypothetical protein SOVF_128060 [Spinacia oleracea]|nr:hypothetical protein SOVF_128060 [Spinacia oleracea]